MSISRLIHKLPGFPKNRDVSKFLAAKGLGRFRLRQRARDIYDQVHEPLIGKSKGGILRDAIRDSSPARRVELYAAAADRVRKIGLQVGDSRLLVFADNLLREKAYQG